MVNETVLAIWKDIQRVQIVVDVVGDRGNFFYG